MRVAIATCRQFPDLPADERRALPALRDAGIDAVPAVWDDPGVDWRSFDAAVVRATWDYHRAPAAFDRWLGRVAAATRLLHPLALARWNLDKRYLLDLAATGVETVPTQLIARGTTPELAALRATLGTEALVVKPTVDASGDRAWRTDRSDDGSAQDRLGRMARDHDLLVQPLVRSIFANGETSLTFFAGRFSHAVTKRAADGEFRIHEERGGATARTQPEPDVIAWGRRVVERVAGLGLGVPLFARVDLVAGPDGPWLMEVELVEPELYFRFDPQSPARWARALADRLHREGAAA